MKSLQCNWGQDCMRQINPNGFQSLCCSMYFYDFVAIKLFDLTWLDLTWTFSRYLRTFSITPYGRKGVCEIIKLCGKLNESMSEFNDHSDDTPEIPLRVNLSLNISTFTTCLVKCGMKWLFHSQTSTSEPLKFGMDKSFHTTLAVIALDVIHYMMFCPWLTQIYYLGVYIPICCGIWYK